MMRSPQDDSLGKLRSVTVLSQLNDLLAPVITELLSDSSKVRTPWSGDADKNLHADSFGSMIGMRIRSSVHRSYG
jgi:hypothetical protein